MKEKRKRRLKKFHFHPTTTFLLLTILVLILSCFLAKLNIQSSYSVINPNTLELETKIVKVKNLLTADGVKLVIGNAANNLASFSAFINLIVALIGLSVAHASGFIKAFIRRNTLNLNNKVITFIIILLGIFSSLVNDVGYVVLIPLSALIFAANKRSPLLGITTAFCGVSFGYGISLFAGSLDVALVELTEKAAYLVDANYHVALLSNIFVMIASSIVLAIVGTIAIETVVVKRIGRYKSTEELESTMDLTYLITLDDKEKIEQEYLTKKGLRNSYIVGIIMIIVFIYMIVPGLPNSGLLLDMGESTYVRQLFGENSYFQSGFTYLTSIWFLATGLAYAFGAKTIKNDKDLIEKISVFYKDIGGLMITIFFFVQFVAVFKKTNIGVVIACWGADLINSLPVSGIVLIILSLLIMSFSGLFLTSAVSKWTIFSPVVVPMMMQSNISPEFAQFVLRAADSMSKGITPLLAYFIIYLGYLNIYNTNKEPITIRKAISFVMPYFSFMILAWLVIVIGWYLVGLPLGPEAMPTL
ncbi:MAG: AbgT family transporter [Bacilli bacterium]|nr:AbgT family transporter [Bacilli bacterium]